MKKILKPQDDDCPEWILEELAKGFAGLGGSHEKTPDGWVYEQASDDDSATTPPSVDAVMALPLSQHQTLGLISAIAQPLGTEPPAEALKMCQELGEEDLFELLHQLTGSLFEEACPICGNPQTEPETGFCESCNVSWNGAAAAQVTQQDTHCVLCNVEFKEGGESYTANRCRICPACFEEEFGDVTRSQYE